MILHGLLTNTNICLYSFIFEANAGAWKCKIMFGELCPAKSNHMKTFHQEKIDMSQGALLTDSKECKGAGLNLYIDSCNSWNFWHPVSGNQVAASSYRNQFQTGEWMFHSCSEADVDLKWLLSVVCGLRWQRSLASWGRIYCLLNDLTSYSAKPCHTFKFSLLLNYIVSSVQAQRSLWHLDGLMIHSYLSSSVFYWVLCVNFTT